MKSKIKFFIFTQLLIVIMCLVISFVLTLLISNNLLNVKTGILLSKIISAIIFVIGGIYLGKKIKSKGYLLGICSILFYLFIILCLSLTNINLSSVNIVVRCICLFAGSITGVNLAKN